MRHRLAVISAITLIPLLAAVWAAVPAGASAAGLTPACPPPASPGEMRCFLMYERGAAGETPDVASGLGATQLESAYRLPVQDKSTSTVGVSIAYDDPELASDLATYRARFGLPPCTTASGCLRIVNEDGQASPLPSADTTGGWAGEETLDTSMISAACPTCHILVVEANSAFVSDLARAASTAARLGAQVVSNSYGARESGVVLPYAKDYQVPGHTFVASAGDFGFTAALFPADLATVVAAGGTQLTRSGDSRGWTEQVWHVPNDEGDGASGSGCSAYVAKPAWQHDPHCPGRTVTDMSAAATNIWLYIKADGGWSLVGGTSAAAPLLAGVFGLAGNGAAFVPGSEYAHPKDFFDVTVGNNATQGYPKQVCGRDYLCVAKKGYDAPTGLGTPDGIAGF